MNMKNERKPPRTSDPGPFYRGTKADLKAGDMLEPGYSSNYGERKKANYTYLTATLDAATWGAELAVGDGPGRIYRVEPTGPIEDDPNLTDKKFPGNPTRSYRTQYPLRVMGEVLDWEGHSPEELKNMRDHLDRLKRLGIEAINKIAMGSQLEQEFHRAMANIYDRAKNEVGYVATRYIQMVAEHGGLATAKMLINTDKPSDGYTALWERRRLDLTVEALVAEDPKWKPLNVLVI